MALKQLFALLILAVLATLRPAPALAERDLLVFAAASLKGVLDQVARDWEDQGGTPVTISYGSSSALARQIEQGAPADVYVSATVDWTDRLVERGFVRPDQVRTFLRNRLVLIAADPEQPEVEITADLNLPALLGPDGILAMALPNAVPAGIYGKAALKHFGLWETVQPRVAGSDNVRVALALVARGEAPFGIVYVTDAKSEPKVTTVGHFPVTSHPDILYPAAVMAEADHPEAQAFFDFLSSDTADARFRAIGFETVD